MAIPQNFPGTHEMTFFDVITRGLKRRPVRTGLTLLGIAVGIAAVVALIGLSRGLVTSWTAGMKSRGTDVVVHNMRGSLTPKPFPAATRDRIAHLPGVAATCMILVRMILLESAMLGLLGGIIGVGLGVIGVHLMQAAPAIRGLLEPDLSFNLILMAVTIAVCVGVLSGFYPAWRSSRLTPSLALHG